MWRLNFPRTTKFIVLGIILLDLLGISSQSTQAFAASNKEPWLIYSTYSLNNVPGSGGLWIVRADGTDKQQVAKDKGIIDLASSPDGQYVAYYSYDFESPELENNIRLNILTLADGTSKMITALTSPATASKGAGDLGPTAAFATSEPPLAWSPDGQMLAFIGAQGPSASADLFVYSLKTGKVQGLSSGPSQAIEPSWSPDGKYILHFGIESFGTGAGSKFAGVWTARADNTGVKMLYKPPEQDEGSLGWIDATSFLAWSWRIQCGKHLLRAYNVESKQAKVWIKSTYNVAAYAPLEGTLLVSVSDYQDECKSDLEPGLYRLTKSDPTPVKISDVVPLFLTWSEGAQTFFALQSGKNGALRAVTPAGIVSDPIPGRTEIPTVSANNKHWAWISDPNQTLYVLDPSASSATPISIAEGVSRLIWSR